MPETDSRNDVSVEYQKTELLKTSLRHGNSPLEDISGVTKAGVGHRSNELPIPQSEDSVTLLCSKLTALMEVVLSGQSIAVATNYAAVAIQERVLRKMPLLRCLRRNVKY